MTERTVRLTIAAACGLLLAAATITPSLTAQTPQTAPPAPAAAAAAPGDPSFSCITNGTKVRNTYISHSDPAQLREATRIFEGNLQGVDYPVGTTLQLVPNEAMVKRSRAAFPNSNGWEYFLLGVAADGTTIRARGDEASNRLGTCSGCHSGASKFDFVCERTHGCAPVPLTDETIARIQTGDPRCAKP